MKRIVDVLTDLSLGGFAAAAVMLFVLLFVWRLFENWMHRRHQRRLAEGEKRRVKLNSWMEGVRREMAKRGHPLPMVALDFPASQAEPHFRWELFFKNGRTAQQAVDAWENDRERDGLSPDCSPRNAEAKRA